MSALAKPFAVYVRGKESFQVVKHAQYAKPAFELARAELAKHWEDYSIGYADCVVVDEEEQKNARKARKVGPARGSARP